MSSASYSPGPDDWLPLLDVLDRHLQRLVAKTAELSATLVGPRAGAPGSDDVQGYLAGQEASPSAATELAELVASLQENGQLLQRVAGRLAQLRALVEASSDAD